jgi:hypothetical protein
VWTSRLKGKPIDTIAIFNLSEKPLDVNESWSNLGLSPGAFVARNLWTGAHLPMAGRLRTTIAPHDVALWRVSR